MTHHDRCINAITNILYRNGLWLALLIDLSLTDEKRPLPNERVRRESSSSVSTNNSHQRGPGAWFQSACRTSISAARRPVSPSIPSAVSCSHRAADSVDRSTYSACARASLRETSERPPLGHRRRSSWPLTESCWWGKLITSLNQVIARFSVEDWKWIVGIDSISEWWSEHSHRVHYFGERADGKIRPCLQDNNAF